MKNILLAATALVMLSSTQQVSAMQACPDLDKFHKNLETYINGKNQEYPNVLFQKGYDATTFAAAVTSPKIDITVTDKTKAGHTCEYAVGYYAPSPWGGPNLYWGPYRVVISSVKLSPSDTPVGTVVDYITYCTGTICAVKAIRDDIKQASAESLTQLKEAQEALKEFKGIKIVDSILDPALAKMIAVTEYTAQGHLAIESGDAAKADEKVAEGLVLAIEAVKKDAETNKDPHQAEVAKEVVEKVTDALSK